MTDTLYYAGIVAVIMTLSAFGLQIHKVFRTKNTKALSYNLMIWLGIAMGMYVIFGISLNEPIIYIGNIIGFTMQITLLVAKWRNEHD